MLIILGMLLKFRLEKVSDFEVDLLFDLGDEILEIIEIIFSEFSLMQIDRMNEL